MPVTQAITADALRQELTELKKLDRSQARTMPPGFYTSGDFHELEKEHIFRREWVCVGHTGEVQEPGDFFTTEVAGEQLLVTRGHDGEVHVLSNVCRHRGNLVETEASGKRRSFVCQYHAWTYATDGALKTAPLMKNAKNFEMKGCRLPQFKTEIWSNFIFVNLDGTAEPLATQLEVLDGILHNYHNEQRNLLFTDEGVWNTNWKNLTENFMEGYHLFATHPKTLQPMTPTQLCRKVPGEPRWTAYRSYYDPEFPPRGPFHEDMTEDEQRNTVLFNIFPSFVVAVAANYTLYLCLRPAGADKVAIRWGVAGFKTDPQDPEVTAYVDLCKSFNAEDREKLETLQVAQNTRYFQNGPLAPDDLEGTIWDFLGYMGRMLGADRDL
ncbi:aromatic ring-hydroxylating oxygenase subunit alpha [Leisingera sp. ANG-M1]|uniref:aromatic ring-hydroxylating oxygenase subunit alpha n=1 Tax=Leisingera sp. ANG-M1 TaxID=1577895 RepID=UPI00068AAFE0|nr:aromatic ring-hydroxylating dioxygenase subunit alpha [Leisingera sp. ANG-M1]